MPGMTWNARTPSAVPVSYTTLLIAQRGVHDLGGTRVERRVRRGRVVEGELGGGQRGQGQLAGQRGGGAGQLEEQRHAVRRELRRQLLGAHGRDAERTGERTSSGGEVAAHHRRAGALEQQR